MTLCLRVMHFHTEAMNANRWIAAAALLVSGFSVFADAPSDPGWPRVYSNGSATAVVYQPQVDSWTDFKLIRGRCAFALTAAPGKGQVYGTFRFEADTLTDTGTKLVLLRNVRAFDMRFPGAAVSAKAQRPRIILKSVHESTCGW